VKHINQSILQTFKMLSLHGADQLPSLPLQRVTINIIISNLLVYFPELLQVTHQ